MDSSGAVARASLDCCMRSAAARTLLLTMAASSSSSYPSKPTPSPAASVAPAHNRLSHDEVRRYSRHLILDGFGVDAQLQLKKARVLSIGSGGLGSPVILYLAAAGVGTIGIVDDDVVDESNLQRQIVHSTDAVGAPKVESARERVRQINPHVHVRTHQTHLSAANALEILRDYDIVVDGSDNFPTRYLVNDACVILGLPFVYGAVQKFEGQASLFNYEGGPTYRDLFPEPPPPGAVPSCAEGGILGVLPGMIGMIQATEAIKALLHTGDTLSGRLLLYDAMRMRFRDVKLSKRTDAPAITELIDYTGFCGQPAAEGAVAAPVSEPFSRIDVRQASERITSGAWSPYVLDVRTAAEAQIVSLPFVDRQYPHRQVAHLASDLAQVAEGGRDILVHCKAGVRSAVACESLSHAGVPAERIFNLDGGIVAWAREVDASMPTY